MGFGFPPFSLGVFERGWRQWQQERPLQLDGVLKRAKFKGSVFPMTRASCKSSSSHLLGAKDPPPTVPHRLSICFPRTLLNRTSAPSTDVQGRPGQPSSVTAERSRSGTL